MQEQARGLSFVRFEIGPGDALRLNVPFPFIDRDHVRAFVGKEDAERQVSMTWLDATTVELPSQDGILDAPFVVLLRRFTPIGSPLISYKDGANLPARDLNKSIRQLLYAHQESAEFGTGGNGGGGNGGGPGTGNPDINVIIDGVMRSPALQDLLTRIDLIDMNAEVVLEEILRAHEANRIDLEYFETRRDFHDVKRDYGDKISTAYTRIELVEEAAQVIARETTELFARFKQAGVDNAARFLEVNEAIADANKAIVTATTELHAQIGNGDSAVSAALNQRIDLVKATTDEAISESARLLGVQMGENRAQIEQKLQAQADKTSASFTSVDNKLAQVEGNFAQEINEVNGRVDATNADVTRVSGQLAQVGKDLAADITKVNTRVDQTGSSVEALRTTTAQWQGNMAETVTALRQKADATQASLENTQTTVTKHGENIAATEQTLQSNVTATGANTSFRTALAARFGTDVGKGIQQEIDKTESDVTAAVDTKIAAEASARGALASQLTTLQTTTAPTYFGASAPAAPTGGFKVPSFWVKTGQTGAYLTYMWDGSSWRKADIDAASPTGALVQQLQSTKIDAAQAQAIASTQVQAFKDGAFATLQQNFSVVAGEHSGMYGQWQANYSVKINAGTVNGVPVVAGIALSANPQTGSDFIVSADRFAFVHPQYTQGGNLASVKYPFVIGSVGGQSTVGIQGALVVDGTITADKIRVNNLSALTANAGTINGGTFKTHTLDGNGNVVNANEFRAEMSNIGDFPLWVGSGGKDGNNAVFYVDRGGGAKFAGRVNAPNVVGQFQSATGISWGGATSLCYRSGNNFLATGDWVQIHSWTLGAPVLAGEGHTPSVSVTVTANRLIYGLHVILEELRDSYWAVIASYEPALYHSLISVMDGTGNSFTHADYYTYDKTVTLSASGAWTGSARQFRVRARATPGYPQVHGYDAASYPDFQIVGVSGFAFGIR